jgi:hypothetical protein
VTYVTTEYAIELADGTLAPVVDQDVARPYALNGRPVLVRRVTSTPVRDSGTAAVRYGPWRVLRAPATRRAAA